MGRRLLRILMINDHIHFGGGGDAVFRLEREAYERAGHEVYTFSQAQARPEEAGPRDVVYIESEIRAVAKMHKFAGHAGVYRALRRLLAETRPDLVRVHLVSKYALSVYPALRGQKVVQTLHGPSLFCATSWGNLRQGGAACSLGIGLKCWRLGCVGPLQALLYSWLYSRLTPTLKRVVAWYHCPSKNIQRAAESLGFGPTRHIAYGIDRSFIAAEPASHEGPPIILYVGALVEQKGVRLLPEALQAIRAEIPQVKLVLAGRGSCEPWLRREFARRGLQAHVQMFGFVEHTRMVDLYRQAHVFVMPSIWSEQFGLVGPEAMACGVPCVASNVGGIPEWLKDGEYGFLVPPRDPQALAARVVRLLSDRDMRLRFGEAGRAYARATHDPDAYQRRWLQLAASCAVR